MSLIEWHLGRINDPAKIKPPAPLPHVSRRALKRVRDVIAPPSECRFCSGPVALVSNAEIYGREYGDWPYAYLCQPCDAYVGLHPNTDLPLGTLADRPLREARKKAKDAFHTWMRHRRLTRSAAYRALAAAMNIKESDCHFGMFDTEQCQAAATAIDGGTP